MDFQFKFVIQDILKNSDGDIYADVYDNCPNVYNDDQSDIDNTGIGDLCDFYTQDNFTLTKKMLLALVKIMVRLIFPQEQFLIIRLKYFQIMGFLKQTI